jgi:hypothetical protein
LPEAKGAYDQIPSELLHQAHIAHFFFAIEGQFNPELQAAVVTLLTRFRLKRTAIISATPETHTPEQIEADLWEDDPPPPPPAPPPDPAPE